MVLLKHQHNVRILFLSPSLHYDFLSLERANMCVCRNREGGQTEDILSGYLDIWRSVSARLCLIRLRGLVAAAAAGWINMSAQTRAITPISAHHSLTTLSSALG